MKSDDVSIYILVWLVFTIYWYLDLRYIINDILIASLPGNYGKALNNTFKIQEKQSLIDRITQRYVEDYVTDQYRIPYRRYCKFRKAFVTYVILTVVLFLVISITELLDILLFMKTVTAISILGALFCMSRIGVIYHKTKYTKNK